VLPRDASALRESLEDRLLLDAVLPLLKGAPLVAADGGAHAAGLPRALAAAGAREALLAARRDADELSALLAGLVASPPSPEVAHHLALLHGRFAETSADHERAVAHLERAIVAWLRLWGEGRYLAVLAERVAGDGGAALLADLPAVLFEPLTAALKNGRRGPTDAARRAMAVLRGAGALAARAGLAPDRRAEVETAAARLLGGVVREVLDEARVMVEPIDPLRAAHEERSAPFHFVLSFASWAGFDAETIVFLLDQAQDQAWELYRARRMSEVRALLMPLVPAINELEARMAREAALFPYRALCAQMFTFLGETEQELRAAIASLERAIAVCPTHRNARLILAGFLLEDAARRLAALPTIGIFGAGEIRRRGLVEVRRLHDRAIELWPEAKVPPSVTLALA
jgi:hypothetical protein